MRLRPNCNLTANPFTEARRYDRDLTVNGRLTNDLDRGSQGTDLGRYDRAQKKRNGYEP